MISLLSLSSYTPQLKQLGSSFEQRVQDAVRELLPAVVVVNGGGNAGEQFGSGFVVDSDQGLVLTNYHVVSRARSLAVRFLDDEQGLPCTLVKFDAKRDLALLKTEETLDVAVRLGQEGGVRVGDFVIAAGSPGGYDHSVSLGIVSAVERDLADRNSDLKFLQVDAPMYRGSSGGPLATLGGEVVGMNSRGGASGAAGFAVPIGDIHNFLAEYYSSTVEKQEKEQPFGYVPAVLQSLSSPLAKALHYDGKGGLVVAHSYPTAPELNLQPLDILLSIGSLNFRGSTPPEKELLENYLAGLGPGEHQATLFRDGKEVTARIALSSQPPCTAEPLETRQASYLIHKKPHCYALPQGQFVEVTRYWESGRSELKRGDLITYFFGESSIQEALKGTADEPQIFQVIRGGKILLAVR